MFVRTHSLERHKKINDNNGRRLPTRGRQPLYILLPPKISTVLHISTDMVRIKGSGIKVYQDNTVEKNYLLPFSEQKSGKKQ